MPTGTPYDDAFRTMAKECSKLLIPVLNEAFGENYTGHETVELLDNTFFLPSEEGRDVKRETDSHIVVVGKDMGRRYYHLECQSTDDGSILMRIFQYASLIAASHSRTDGYSMDVEFPHSALIALRPTGRTPEKMQIRLHIPENGAISYHVPVLKVKNYTVDEIFDKKLYFFIPFHIFAYEAELKAAETDAAALYRLESHYRDIVGRLEKLCLGSEISEYDKYTIIASSKSVIEGIAAKYDAARKGLGDIMSGQVIDFEAKRIRDASLAEGRVEGRVEGIMEMAVKLYHAGMPISKIVPLTELPESEIRRAVANSGKRQEVKRSQPTRSR